MLIGAFVILLFQSTLPARGATGGIEIGGVGERDFNPRSPRGERPPFEWLYQHKENISIHAPREGSDNWRYRKMKIEIISIHAPREGSDWAFKIWNHGQQYFNPRSPRGERRMRTRFRSLE